MRLAAVFAAALGAAATSAQLRLPFKRQSYPHSTSGSQELSNGRRSISEVDFFTAENAYLVNVTLGTPPQDLSVLLTVQQAETWVPNQLTCDLQSYSVKYGSCKYGSFMAKNSSSYVNPGDEDFKAIIPEGYAYGKIMKETLSIGGFKLPNFEMGLADRANSYIGTLGLASNTTAYDRLYPSNPTRGKYTPTFLERLLTDGGINSTAYSLWLDDDSGDSGNLLLGAIDRSKFQESLIRFPVDTSLTTLKLFGSKIHSVNGSRNSANPFQPLGGLDTLSLYKPVVRIAPHNTISWLPYYLARHIYELAGAVWDDQLQARAVNCNSKASTAQLAVQLHGADGPILNVPVSDLVGPGVPGRTMRSAGTNWCLFGVQSYNTSDPYRYTLGGTMLKRAYMVFDLANGEIAIGKTKFDSATREDVVYFPSYGAKVPESSAVSPSPGWCYEHSSSEYCSSDRTRPIYGDDEESKSRFRGGITKGGWIAIAVCMSVVVVIIVVLSIRAFRKWRRIKREEKELAGEHQNAMCAAYGVSGKQTGLTSQRKVDIIHHANMCTMSRESDENTITSGRRQ